MSILRKAHVAMSNLGVKGHSFGNSSRVGGDWLRDSHGHDFKVILITVQGSQRLDKIFFKDFSMTFP